MLFFLLVLRSLNTFWVILQSSMKTLAKGKIFPFLPNCILTPHEIIILYCCVIYATYLYRLSFQQVYKFLMRIIPRYIFVISKGHIKNVQKMFVVKLNLIKLNLIWNFFPWQWLVILWFIQPHSKYFPQIQDQVLLNVPDLLIWNPQSAFLRNNF